MDFDKPLAVVTAGGITVAAVGAIVARLLSWPTGGALGVPLAAVGIVVLGLCVALVGAIVWGRRTAPRRSETPYWTD